MRVAVLTGVLGRTPSQSLLDAVHVLGAVRALGHDAVEVGQALDRRWLAGNGSFALLVKTLGLAVDGLADAPAETAGLRPLGGVLELCAWLRAQCDVAFLAIRGALGGSGRLQAILEAEGIPFTGSGSVAAALAVNKPLQKAIFRAHGLAVAPSLVVSRQEWEADRDRWTRQAELAVGYPCFVKPTNQGGSVGVSQAKTKMGLVSAVHYALQHDSRVLIEPALEGREISVAVLGDEDPAVSPPGEVRPRTGWYDLAAKSAPGLAEVIVPAPLSADERAAVGAQARIAYLALGCRGHARVDFFLTRDGWVINELNTSPAFTRVSMVPRVWEAAGIAYEDLVDRLIRLAIARHDAERAGASPIGVA